MRVYLVQHGAALPKAADPERSLSDKGRADLEALAAHLAACEVAVDRVVHSGKLRARQTADILAAALAGGRGSERVLGLEPEDPVEPMAAQIDNFAEDTILVGHQPFMGRLASWLVSGWKEPPSLAFSPGGMACLEREGEDGAWAVRWMLRPELLPRAR